MIQITIKIRSVMRVVIFLVVVGVTFAIIWPVYLRVLENSDPNSCQSNLKQVALGVMQYVQDYDEHYPLVNVHDTNISSKRPLGWADALQPYLRSTQIFHCPQNKDRKETSKPNENDYTDYWFNRNLAGGNSEKIKYGESIFLFGDGNDGTDATNARYSLSSLPSAWRTDKSSPAFRHIESKASLNFAFADGHVKWLDLKSVSTKSPDGINATFRIK